MFASWRINSMLKFGISPPPLADDFRHGQVGQGLSAQLELISFDPENMVAISL
ncbi:hypothetical protein DKB71_37425 (plasmid) [Pseudomonas sp. PLMAX]